MSQLVPPVVLKASKKHTGKCQHTICSFYFCSSATLVFLNGLGDTGFGWAGALNTIRPDFLKVISFWKGRFINNSDLLAPKLGEKLAEERRKWKLVAVTIK